MFPTCPVHQVTLKFFAMLRRSWISSFNHVHTKELTLRMMNKIMPTNWDGPKDTTQFIQIKLLRIIFISTASTCASCRFLSINQGGHYISQPKQCTLMAGDHPLSTDLNNFSRLSNGLDLDPLVVDKTPGALPQSLGLGGWWLKWVHLPQFSG